MKKIWDIDILDDVANWKKEASSEDMSRYFFQIDGFKRIATGDVNIVVGRKGTGKTAIIRYLEQTQTFDCRVKRITLKDFPIEEFGALTTSTFLRRDMFINAWKFVIYNSILDLMAQNPKLDARALAVLKDRYSDHPELRLTHALDRWKASSSKFSVGMGDIVPGMSLPEIAYEQASAASSQPKTLVNQIHAMESFVDTYIDGASYFVLFDGLDSDFASVSASVEKKSIYLDLVGGLVKAVTDVCSIMRGRNRVYPIAFVRDDLFSLLGDEDQGKWDDHLLRLTWRRDQIRNMLAYRISRAVDAELADSMNFSQAWSFLFYPETEVEITRRGRSAGKKDIFEFILRRSLLRPRDFINYLQLCADVAKGRNKKVGRRIAPKIVADTELAFSESMRREFVGEMLSVIPYIADIFKLANTLPNSAYFSYEQFVEMIDRGKDEGRLPAEMLKEIQILRILFAYSAIGNLREFRSENEKKSRYYGTFVYRYPNAELDVRSRMCFHSSLVMSLFDARGKMMDHIADKDFVDDAEPQSEEMQYEIRD